MMKNLTRIRHWYCVGQPEDPIPGYSSNAPATLKEARQKRDHLRMLFPDTAESIKVYKCSELFACVEVEEVENET